jgi:CubicO group peptidase (beta-lactamase class C family)
VVAFWSAAVFLSFGGAAQIRAGTLSEAVLQAAGNYSASHGGSALLVLQHGKTLYAGGAVQQPHKIFSGTKGFWVLAALAASEDGILNLDEYATDALVEWLPDPRKSRITVRNLLSFTGGLEPKFELHGNGFDNRNRLALNAASVAAPGAAFIYGPASLQAFEEFFRRKLAAAGQTPERYLERKVLRPLGLGSQRYLEDGSGNPLLATGFLLTAEQWGRLGEVVAAHGRPVVSPHLFDQCCHGTGPNGGFGMGFWNNLAAASGGRETDVEDQLERKWWEQDWRDICLCRDAPPDLVAGIGSGYQRLYVVPSRDLVVVRFGNGSRFPDAEFLRLLLRR